MSPLHGDARKFICWTTRVLLSCSALHVFSPRLSCSLIELTLPWRLLGLLHFQDGTSMTFAEQMKELQSFISTAATQVLLLPPPPLRASSVFGCLHWIGLGVSMGRN